MCDYMGCSTSNIVGLSISVQEAMAIHPKPLQRVLRVPGHGQRWSWPFGIATAAQEVKSGSSVSNISTKEM
ncbi:hypothetical protein llap_8363 [Limosa lapponica baueri]|uniref:Uncharacterized protein n=1 Tax=Limosa lapponica baueri TaxID=1758121 RepID=A0A2I0U5L3_LIMLA|nr:hypothetical protein llap_8363 [Limosa lapponica baueri]